MKAIDFQDFTAEGKFGGNVLVQLKDPRTFCASLNEKREIEPAQFSEEATLQLYAQKLAAEGATPEQIQEILRRGGPGRQPIPPVPILSGELSILGELLVLTYESGETKFRVTICPDDIKHITSPVNRHIHL